MAQGSLHVIECLGQRNLPIAEGVPDFLRVAFPGGHDGFANALEAFGLRDPKLFVKSKSSSEDNEPAT